MGGKIMVENTQPTYIFKICLLGGAAVGKTCIARRLCFNTFDSNTKLTIGIDFYTFDLPIELEGNQEDGFVRLSIWDFGGQQQFKRLFPYYINGVNGIFMVFELINLQSLLDLDYWFKHLAQKNILAVPKIFLGTKHDLVEETNSKEKVNDLIIDQFLKRHNETEYLKTSSKENFNILQSFKELVIKVLNYNSLPYKKLK
ncbi:MAG: GTP-binding protein [Promethearchaeota archaeon]|nr:MAG: GTP-binding protein [Candidatus Lokiarchaeota archaeon]